MSAVGMCFRVFLLFHWLAFCVPSIADQTSDSFDALQLYNRAMQEHDAITQRKLLVESISLDPNSLPAQFALVHLIEEQDGLQAALHFLGTTRASSTTLRTRIALCRAVLNL
jgi:hypothetical protein